LGENCFKDEPSYLHYHQTLNVITYENVFKGLSFLILELPKFREQNLHQDLDAWLHFFKSAASEADIPEQIHSQTVLRGYERMQHMLMDKFQKDEYIKAHMIEVDEAKNLESAQAQGHAQGHAQGVSEGEKKKAQEMAEGMLNDKMPVDMVAKYSGLTVAEILEIERNMAHKRKIDEISDPEN
jgi:predicted transposase/invertase (TIGR01784 family)